MDGPLEKWPGGMEFPFCRNFIFRMQEAVVVVFFFDVQEAFLYFRFAYFF